MILLVLALVIAVSTGASQQSSSSGSEQNMGTASNQAVIFWTIISGFASLLATQVFSILSDYRRRRWDLQDRATAREEMRANTERIRLETVATAVQLSRNAKNNREILEGKIAENTALTQAVGQKADAAYEAGNNFTQRIDALRAELFGNRGQIDHIEHVSEDTNVKVTELTEKDKGSDDESPRAGRGR